MMKTAILFVFVVVPMLAQQQPQIPNFKAPPGHTVKVESVVTRYNFSGFNREVIIPLEPFMFQPHQVPKGYKETPKVKPATKIATQLWNSWESVLPAFGAPSKKSAQQYVGADGGVILYFQWDRPLPSDARKAICRVLYKADEKPTSDTKDEVMVTDNWVIIWSFSKPLSKLKEAHQKHAFAVVNSEATKWMDANPEKAAKYKNK